MRKGLVLLLALLLLVGCSQPLPPPEARLPDTPPGKPIAHAAEVGTYNQFGFSLYHRLAGPQKNTLISPVSIGLALSMAYNGAAGDTRAAMAEALLVAGLDLTELNQANKVLLAELEASDVTVAIANSLWLKKGISFLPSFVENNQNYYNAEVTELNFNSAKAAPTINQWVSDHTNKLIKEIVQGPLDPLAVAFLVNAVYFQGDWTDPFLATATRDDYFLAPVGEQLVPFMHKTANFDYLETTDLQAVRLPYGKGNMAMYIFLPTDLASFQESLTQAQWTTWRTAFHSERGNLALPKFEFAYEQTLNTALTDLGMGIAFDSHKADFSNMAEHPDIYINDVRHKSFIRVDEKGTEAAAVTSILCGTTSMPPPPTFTMKVDRPFFFMIHDQQTDAILFMGTVYDPSK